MSEILKNAESAIVKALVWSLPMFIVLILVPLLSLNSFLKPENQDIAVWFQRSGSIMVAFSVWLELNLYRASNHIYLTGFNLGGPEERLANKYKFIFSAAKIFGFLGAVLGTIIWGYGDIIYKSFI